VGQAVNLAVERFVTVGETIADDNPDIKQDMYEACKEARAAGERGIYESLCGKLISELLKNNAKPRAIWRYVRSFDVLRLPEH